MEQYQDTSLFGLSIDPTIKSHLSETARWARFLAICGFVFLGLLIIYGVVLSTVMSTAFNQLSTDMSPYNKKGLGAGFGIIIIVYMVVIAVIYFFPILFTLRFANHMKSALATNNQELLTESFKNLKITLRYLGILTIIGLVIFGISIVFILIAGMATGFM